MNEAPEAPIQRPLVELPSGVIIDIAKIAFIAKRELNQYVIYFQNTAVGPFLTGEDLDALREYGIVQKVVVSAPAAANDEASKIEVAPA